MRLWPNWLQISPRDGPGASSEQHDHHGDLYMIRSKLIGTAALAAGLTFAIQANAGPLALQVGYDTCKNEIQSQQKQDGMVFLRHHYLHREAESNTYFINSTAWGSGVRVALKSACETSINGRRILALETSQGRWNNVPEGRVDIEVAGVN